MDKPDLYRRAVAAYFRNEENAIGNQPSQTISGVERANGKLYCVLRNARGVLKVYRVRNDGMLKGLKRWPAGLEA